MAFDRLEIDAPSDIHKMFADNHAEMMKAQEPAKPDFKNTFNQSAQFGATQITADAARDMGMDHAINPAEPVRIEPEQKTRQAIDPQEITSRAELSGQFLQEAKMGQQIKPGMKPNDSIFGAACNTISSEVQGISKSMQGLGPDMAGMDPRLLQSLQMQQQFMMKPSSFL